MMKTRRTRHSIELPCCICDQPYAEVFRGQLAVYSSHFGKPHASAFSLKELKGVLEVVQAGNYLEVKCGTCNLLPCAVVQRHQLTITTKHKDQTWQTHSNGLTLADIAEICRMIAPTDAILADELDVAS